MERLVGSLYREDDEKINFIITAENHTAPIDREISPEEGRRWLLRVGRRFHHPFRGSGVYSIDDDVVAAWIILQRLGSEPGLRVEFRETPSAWENEEGILY